MIKKRNDFGLDMKIGDVDHVLFDKPYAVADKFNVYFSTCTILVVQLARMKLK